MATTSTTQRKRLLPSTASSCWKRKQQGKFIEINAKNDHCLKLPFSMVIIIEKSFIFCTAWYLLFTENLFLTALLYSMSIAFSLQNIVKNNAFNHLVLEGLCWNFYSLTHNCKSWYVVRVIFIPWSSFFNFLTWTHVPCFLLPIIHRHIPFNHLVLFFLCWNLFSLMHNCKSWYVVHVIFIPWSSFFHFLTWTHVPCFFSSNYPQAHSIQSPGAFFPLLEPFFIDAQL